MDDAVNPAASVEEFEVTVTLRTSSIEGVTGTAIMSRTDISGLASLDAESQMVLTFSAANGLMKSGIGNAAEAGIPMEKTMSAAQRIFMDAFEVDESAWPDTPQAEGR